MDATGILSANTIEELGSSSDTFCIGSVLREARIRAGLDLAQVSADLKIRETYLQAIEEMDRSALPHQTYALGFVRCYASYLGFNAQRSVDNFKADGCTSTTGHRDISIKPIPFWLEISIPRGFGLAVALIGMLALVSWFGQRSAVPLDTIPPVPEMLGSWSQGMDLDNIPAITSEPSPVVRAEPTGG